MKTADVSILLCTYNRADLLSRAVDSVLNQSYSAWELIIVDDGSTDETASVIERYREADERIRSVRHENQGLPKSRNLAIENARGAYLALIDDDDEYSPDHIEKRMGYMLDNPEVDIMWGGLIPCGPEERQYVMDMENPGGRIHLSECFVSGTLFGKIQAFRELGGFRDIEYAEDWDFIKRAQNKFTVHRVYYPTYLYYTDAPNRMSDVYAARNTEVTLSNRRRGK
jgi:glycosyltransferase involved in cell wall biosynthesis